MVDESSTFPKIHKVIAGSMARNPALGLHGVAAYCGGVERHDASMLQAAATLFERADRPLERAYAHEQASLILAENRHGAEAEAALDTAIELYESLGASWDVDRSAALLRRFGFRRARARPSLKPGRARLTDMEHRIAARVSKGTSTADIADELSLSRRTVQNHVSNILGKLGLSSRVELVSAYRAPERMPARQQ